ncbi:MAG: hypothetical protein HFH82_14975 [Lachnospiraceae bacterium]|nr:hypothetical protein [Lachnospiraceae bacterium]
MRKALPIGSQSEHCLVKSNRESGNGGTSVGRIPQNRLHRNFFLPKRL